MLARSAPVPAASGRRSQTAEVVRLVNVERARRGRPPLRHAPRLRRSALTRAADMAARDYFGHGGWLAAIRASGYLARVSRIAGENIAYGQDTPAQVVAEWMASPSHRRNILSPSFRAIGVGRVDDIWVQHFGGR